MGRFFHKKLFLRTFAVLFAMMLSFFGARLIFAFVGPTQNPPNGTAAIDVNYSTNNLGIGLAADAQVKVLINNGTGLIHALKVQNGPSSPALFIKSDGAVGVATGTYAAYSTAALSVQGNLIVNGTIRGQFIGSLGGADTTLSANNVTAGVFGTCATCSIGDYAFPQKLGVNTTTQVSLPQPFSSYGGAYFANNVGVGKTVPTFRLHVKSDASGGGIALERSGSGADTAIQFKNEVGNNKAKILFGGTNEEISFFGGSGGSEHARITSAGYLGIATTSPSYPLSVQGDIGLNVGVYRRNGVGGATATCTSGQIPATTTVSGGIITSVSCANPSAFASIMAENVIPGKFGANQGAGYFSFPASLGVGVNLPSGSSTLSLDAIGLGRIVVTTTNGTSSLRLQNQGGGDSLEAGLSGLTGNPYIAFNYGRDLEIRRGNTVPLAIRGSFGGSVQINGANTGGALNVSGTIRLENGEWLQGKLLSLDLPESGEILSGIGPALSFSNNGIRFVNQPYYVFSGESIYDTEGRFALGTTSPGTSSIMELVSTNKGFVLPRMSKGSRNLIAQPVAGMMIYQTDNTPGIRVYDGTNWKKFTESNDP